MNGTGLLSQPALQAALLAAAGALAYWLKDVPGLVVSWARRFFISTLTVDSRDEFLFSALVEYMDTHPRLRGACPGCAFGLWLWRCPRGARPERTWAFIAQSCGC